MHIDLNTIIALGVGAHLLGAIAKTLFKTPRQQAQIDAIEAKIDGVISQLTGAASKTAGKDGG